MTRKEIKRHNLKIWSVAVGLAVIINTILFMAYGIHAINSMPYITMACVFPGMVFYQRLEDATDTPKPPQQ